MAYSTDKQNPLLPSNNKTANEVIIVVEAYRTLRDRVPYPANQVDADGSIPFFWRTGSEENVVVSENPRLLRQLSCMYFSVCFFTTSGVEGNAKGGQFRKLCGTTGWEEEAGMPRIGSAANWSSHY
ncbi:hypothetical protein MKW94_016090 [Papaver nudicaule]|uniref:DUF3700 domain-containing protein n=1 Tax=Papaver nudicaule TaxID=74823 RepID=A0AA41VB15_PAPNU|nr:hypothetical protein [Papaver nudicaule]